ncbi:hypothetical protein ACLOJK_039172, partial [Asimina triloba]
HLLFSGLSRRDGSGGSPTGPTPPLDMNVEFVEPFQELVSSCSIQLQRPLRPTIQRRFTRTLSFFRKEFLKSLDDMEDPDDFNYLLMCGNLELSSRHFGAELVGLPALVLEQEVSQLVAVVEEDEHQHHLALEAENQLGLAAKTAPPGWQAAPQWRATGTGRTSPITGRITLNIDGPINAGSVGRQRGNTSDVPRWRWGCRLASYFADVLKGDETWKQVATASTGGEGGRARQWRRRQRADGIVGEAEGGRRRGRWQQGRTDVVVMMGGVVDLMRCSPATTTRQR